MIEELPEQNQWKPVEPNKLNLEVEASRNSTGANIHSLGNYISQIMLRYDLGETGGWNKESREFYDKALQEFYALLARGKK